MESPSTCSAGIDDHAAREVEDQLLVGVAVYNDVRVGVGLDQLLRLGPAQLIAMTHVQAEFLEHLFESQWQVRIADRVAVAGDRVDRSDRPQLVQDVIAADVAGVKDEVDPRKDRMDRRAQHAVRVGDESESDHFRTMKRHMVQS